MAITVLRSARFGRYLTGSPTTLSFDCTGADALLVFVLGLESPWDATVEVGGQPLSIVLNGSGPRNQQHVRYLLTPPSGLVDVAITVSTLLAKQHEVFFVALSGVVAFDSTEVTTSRTATVTQTVPGITADDLAIVLYQNYQELSTPGCTELERGAAGNTGGRLKVIDSGGEFNATGAATNYDGLFSTFAARGVASTGGDPNYFLRFPAEGALFLDLPVLLSGHFNVKAELTWYDDNLAQGQKIFDSPTGDNRFDINIEPNGEFGNRDYMSVRVDGVTGALIQSGVKHTVEIFRDATHTDQLDKELQWIGRRYEPINAGFFYFQSDLHSLEIRNAAGTLINNYSATYPDGTGTIWADSVGGNTARQVDTWPADNSEWVLEGQVVVAPSNAPAITTPVTTTSTSVSGDFTFDASSNTGDPVTEYEVRLDSGAWQSLGIPDPLSFTVSGLVADTIHNTPGLELRAINSAGPGPVSAAVTFTTDSSPTGSLNKVNFNSSCFISAPTLGDLLTGTVQKIKLVSDYIYWANSGIGYWCNQTTSTISTREFGIYKINGKFEFYQGGVQVDMGSVTALFGGTGIIDGKLEFELDLVASTYTLTYNDVVVRTGTGSGSVARADGANFRIGARGGSSTPDPTSGSWKFAQDEQVGDTRVYLDRGAGYVLEREYIIPSSGLTIPDTANAQDGTMQGTFTDAQYISYGDPVEPPPPGGVPTATNLLTSGITSSSALLNWDKGV